MSKSMYSDSIGGRSLQLMSMAAPKAISAARIARALCLHDVNGKQSVRDAMTRFREAGYAERVKLGSYRITAAGQRAVECMRPRPQRKARPLVAAGPRGPADHALPMGQPSTAERLHAQHFGFAAMLGAPIPEAEHYDRNERDYVAHCAAQAGVPVTTL